jgi:hypothetical protein
MKDFKNFDIAMRQSMPTGFLIPEENHSNDSFGEMNNFDEKKAVDRSAPELVKSLDLTALKTKLNSSRAMNSKDSRGVNSRDD